MTFKHYIFNLIFILIVLLTFTLCTYAEDFISIYDSESDKNNVVIEVIHNNKTYRMVVSKSDLAHRYFIIENFVLAVTK